jgi:hypothetical protein
MLSERSVMINSGDSRAEVPRVSTGPPQAEQSGVRMFIER